MAALPELILPDAAAWRAWLDHNESTSSGVRLLLAKKAALGRDDVPTVLTYELALDEALCSGWIDGQLNRVDDLAHWQRFTPRRRASMWSQRNREHIARLEAEGRMRERGRTEVEQARADGRWDRAYAGPATIAPTEELAAELAASPDAARFLATLSGQNRYAVLYRAQAPRTPAGRERAAARLVSMLARGEEPR